MNDNVLSMTATRIPSEPMVGETDRDWEHNSWSIKLTFQTRDTTIKFHTGLGVDGEPTIGDVLSSLAADVSGVLNGETFEDFASDFGWDTDSRRAERTYNACKAQAETLKWLLGEEYLNVVAFHAPDDGDWSEFEGNSITLVNPDDEDEDEDDETYKIVRFRQDGDSEVIETGLTLDEAQAHCNREDTHGDGWFDGYTAE